MNIGTPMVHFDCIPNNLFGQLYIIHVKQFNIVFPVVYALLPNKSKNTYKKLLQVIKELKQNLNPATIMTDFEQAAISAFQEEFPDNRGFGCFFHLTQNVWRRIQLEGLQVRF